MTDSAGRILYNKLCENEFIHRRTVCSQYLDEHGASGPNRELVKVQETGLCPVSRSGGGRKLFLPSGGVSCPSEMGRASRGLRGGRTPHVPDRFRKAGREGSFSGDSFPGGRHRICRGFSEPDLSPYRGRICDAGIADGKKRGGRRTAGAPFAGGGFFFCGKRTDLLFRDREKKLGDTSSGSSHKRGTPDRRDGSSGHGEPPLRAGHEKTGICRRGGGPAPSVSGGRGGAGRFFSDPLPLRRGRGASEGEAPSGNGRRLGGRERDALCRGTFPDRPQRGPAVQGRKLPVDPARRFRRIYSVFKEEEETPWLSE